MEINPYFPVRTNGRGFKLIYSKWGRNEILSVCLNIGFIWKALQPLLLLYLSKPHSKTSISFQCVLKVHQEMDKCRSQIGWTRRCRVWDFLCWVNWGDIVKSCTLKGRFGKNKIRFPLSPKCSQIFQNLFSWIRTQISTDWLDQENLKLNLTFINPHINQRQSAKRQTCCFSLSFDQNSITTHHDVSSDFWLRHHARECGKEKYDHIWKIICGGLIS